jgi:hypothetical protein
MNTLPATIREAITFFADTKTCQHYVAACRWPNGIRCPVCGSRRTFVDVSRGGWECRTRHPKRRFTLKTGTLFESSRVGFDKWLPAIWIVANFPRAGAKGIERRTGVTYRTAWFMLRRIQLAMNGTSTEGR